MPVFFFFFWCLYLHGLFWWLISYIFLNLFIWESEYTRTYLLICSPNAHSKCWELGNQSWSPMWLAGTHYLCYHHCLQGFASVGNYESRAGSGHWTETLIWDIRVLITRLNSCPSSLLSKRKYNWSTCLLHCLVFNGKKKLIAQLNGFWTLITNIDGIGVSLDQ